MITLLFFGSVIYVLTGIGAYTGYYKKEPNITNLVEILTWPVTVFALLTAALRKYLELK